MKSTRLMVLPALLVTAMASTANAADPRQIASENLKLWNEALRTRSIGKIESLYTKDAIVITPNGRPAAGADSVGAFWNAQILGGLDTHDIEIVDVYGSDDRVYVTGRWSALRANESGSFGAGNLVSVIERQPDGTWKTRYQSWN